VGFTKDDKGNLSITNVNLILERQTSAQGASGAGVPPATAKFSMSVPLLSILPIPFIRIENLTANSSPVREMKNRDLRFSVRHGNTAI
jgi:hypothetical protein